MIKIREESNSFISLVIVEECVDVEEFVDRAKISRISGHQNHVNSTLGLEHMSFVSYVIVP